jgi:hypothetical protein
MESNEEEAKQKPRFERKNYCINAEVDLPPNSAQKYTGLKNLLPTLSILFNFVFFFSANYNLG